MDVNISVPLFAANGIPTITVTEKDSKHGIRLCKGEHEYPKAYKGRKLLWDVNDELLPDNGLHIPDKNNQQRLRLGVLNVFR